MSRLHQYLRCLPWAFLAGCLVASFYFARQGWDLPLIDLWRFRETQTAFAVRDFVENGFHLAYETPVLGAPWSIPFEFPTYQICVALVVKLTGLPIDPAGRWVSLGFAYAAFTLLGVFVWRASSSWVAGVYAAALTFISPLYIYGARSVMIESTALFFTLGMLVAAQEFLRRPAWRPLLWTFVLGAIAGPTKATTYAIGLVGLACLLLRDARGAWGRLRAAPQSSRLAPAFVGAIVLPLLLTLVWTHYTDVVKSRNEFATFLTSHALREWNFGTWAQRLDLNVWEKISNIISHDLIGLPIVWLLGVIIVAIGAAGTSLGPAVTLSLMFAAGMLAFTNLYQVHNYYHFATGLFLLALFGLGLGGLWERGGAFAKFLVGALVAPLLGLLMLAGFTQHTLPRQLVALDPTLALADAIKRYTPPGSAIIVYGSDWDSALPYYAERHAIMERNGYPPNHPILQRALARLDRPLAAVVFRGIARDSLAYDQDLLNGLGAVGPLVFSDYSGDVYLMQKSETPSVLPWRNLGFEHLHPTFQSAYEVRASGYQIRSGMMIHAPGVMKIPRPANIRLLRFSFGMEERSYETANGTDGVTFAVDFVDEAGQTTRLWERRLEPVAVATDRGSHTVEFILPPNQAGTLVFHTDPGPGSACDWSVWHDVQFQ